jgi:hypothetical protein
MECWHCHKELLWKSDETIEDDEQGEWMLTCLSCQGCSAEVEVYLKVEQGRAGHGK